MYTYMYIYIYDIHTAYTHVFPAWVWVWGITAMSTRDACCSGQADPVAPMVP